MTTSNPTSKAHADNTTDDTTVDPVADAIAGLGLRSIGPAFMGGRIADIAVHPTKPTTWYLAVGSGGVWKTTNAGTTWKPIFDDQASFSIGCITLDPNEPDVVWVGTGESVSGRHVAWGDGVYRSRNGGASWERMGLERSEHIGSILIDPRRSSTVYVAAEGPLWSKGGERGVYKTIDGGTSWELVLDLDADTGVTSLVFAPDNPDVLYAASYQRRRSVAAFLGAGPGSGLHKSTDGGATWRKLTEGLPETDMGKIGLAVTNANPSLVYATIEADEETRGFYRSTDRGESWERRNEYLSGGTGPHYYQEIFASPHDADRVYQVDVFVHVTRDGGKSFNRLEPGRNKHSDNHVVWIDPADPDHLLVGTDAGLYETFDEGQTFRHFPNLPLAQFYRIAVDNAVPFTNVLAGAQDLGTIYGPTRSTNVDGVRNQDWSVALGADGYHTAFDPDDPAISYLEWQEGNVMRHDRRTMELTDIRPYPAQGEPPERWNWDSPIVVSRHRNDRIYVASQRVWRSDDRGNAWTAISGDLTTGRNRYEMALFDTVASVDSLYDHMAMSRYATISHVCESPIDENVLYAGTDDGLVHVTVDGGTTWRAAGDLPRATSSTSDGSGPFRPFINNVVASEHDADVVFVAADDHKHGDYTPYLFKSTDQGRTWTSIRGNLPDGTTVWTLQQDHVEPQLLFIGTEFGVSTSLDGGGSWHKLTKDVPTISFRDLKIQRRDDDLVAASFGRGIYVLDDYGPLRAMASAGTADTETVGSTTTLFPVRDAWWYVPHTQAQAAGQPTLGSSAFRADNPPFGAVATYLVSEALADELSGPKGRRHKTEKAQREQNEDVVVAGVDELWLEHVSSDPALLLIVRNADGSPVRFVAAEAKAGLHRTAWDLRRPAVVPVSLDKPEFEEPWVSTPQGPLVAPGRYSIELAVASTDGLRSVGDAQHFSVAPIPALEADKASQQPGEQATQDFIDRTASLARGVEGAKAELETLRKRLPVLRATALQTPTSETTGLVSRADDIHRSLEELRRDLVVDPVSDKLYEAAAPTVAELVGRISFVHWRTSGPPTQTQVDGLAAAADGFTAARNRLTQVREQLDTLAGDLDAAGGTWTPR